MSVNKPPRLAAGARIGVIAPAGCVERKSLEAGMDAIRAAGFQVEPSRNLLATKGYLAGAAEERAEDLTRFFLRDDIDAIFCARGGFGSVQLLPHLSAEIGRHPKIFVGYSDVTILLNWLRQFCGMATFHAPMVAMDFARGLSATSKIHLWTLLTGERSNWQVGLGEVIRAGKAESELMGGCLSMLVTTLGTPYEIDTRGKLLFLEDVGEKPYRVERMLTHLRMAGKLSAVAGVLFGDFTDCEGDSARGIREVVSEMFHDAAYPVVLGMQAGHGAENLALPFGVRMRLDGDRAKLEMLETPVS
ncbi:MAG TPA: LD-carboxypeptidase [Candidatus Binatia bacterium]|nr:LD-carboxypeptidase [Candidatus Binatia bacterium]